MLLSRFHRRSLPAYALLLGLLPGHASPAQQAAALPPAVAPHVPPSGLEWVPQGMTALAQQASSHTDFTVDRSMLALAGNLYGVDDPTRQAIARLNGIALHLYRFPGRNTYNPALVEGIRAQYGGLGWKHYSTTKQEPGPIGEAGARTDVWLNTQGVNVAGATILLAGPSSVDLIAVSGDLKTLDLLRLRGHFGIPRFPEDALPH